MARSPSAATSNLSSLMYDLGEGISIILILKTLRSPPTTPAVLMLPLESSYLIKLVQKTQNQNQHIAH